VERCLGEATLHCGDLPPERGPTGNRARERRGREVEAYTITHSAAMFRQVGKDALEQAQRGIRAALALNPG